MLGNGTLTMRGKRGLPLGDDGSEVIKRHPWFRGVDWESTSCSCFLPHPAPLLFFESTPNLSLDLPGGRAVI